MATSEALRKAETTSPDRSGESRYEVAKAYFVATHEMLANFGEGAVLPLTSRRKVWEVLEQMRYALSVGPLEAKHAQIEAAAGRPLTVCFGERRRRRIPELKLIVDAEIEWGLFGDGCGIVFADSVTDSRPVFARYCSVCREKSESRRRSEIVVRSAAAACDGRFAVAGGWRLTCRGCGERFFSDAPQRRRCDHCRH